MAASKPVVVDTNILFSALLRQDSRFARIILGSTHLFYICESVIVELFKHKERIVRLSKLSEEDIVKLFYTLLRRVTVSKEELIDRSIRQEAYRLCASKDETDTPQVALTLQLDGLLWTGDEALKTELRKQGFDAFFEADQLPDETGDRSA